MNAVYHSHHLLNNAMDVAKEHSALLQYAAVGGVESAVFGRDDDLVLIRKSEGDAVSFEIRHECGAILRSEQVESELNSIHWSLRVAGIVSGVQNDFRASVGLNPRW